MFYCVHVCFSEREVPPRFADPGSVEYAVASEWKSTYDTEKQQREDLEQQLRQARNTVLRAMETLKEQHQTELIRQELAHHQQEQLRLVQELRMRQVNAMPGNSFMDAAGSPGPGYPPMPNMEMNQEVRLKRCSMWTHCYGFLDHVVALVRESFSAGQWWYGDDGYGGNGRYGGNGGNVSSPRKCARPPRRSSSSRTYACVRRPS